MNAGKGFQNAYIESYPVGEPVLRKAELAWPNADGLSALSRDLGTGPFALIILLVTPRADFKQVVQEVMEVATEEIMGLSNTEANTKTGRRKSGTMITTKKKRKKKPTPHLEVWPRPSPKYLFRH